MFLGAGVPVYGPETPANKRWYWPELPQTPHDPAAAGQLLASIGLTDRNGDGLLEDAQQPAGAVHAAHAERPPDLERGAAVIRDELKKIGLDVDVVALDSGAVIEHSCTRKYDAIYFNADTTRHRSGDQPRFLVQFRRAPRLEPGAEDARHRRGSGGSTS